MAKSVRSFCVAFIGLQCAVFNRAHIAAMQFIGFTKFADVSSANNVSKRRSEAEIDLKFRAIAALFSKHISHIITVSPYKKMVRAHTARIIAMMTNFQRFIESAISHFVRKPMSIFPDTLLPFSTDKKSAIHSIMTFLFACPIPTGFCFGNTFPKSFFKRSHDSFLFHKNDIITAFLTRQVLFMGYYA